MVALGIFHLSEKFPWVSEKSSPFSLLLFLVNNGRDLENLLRVRKILIESERVQTEREDCCLAGCQSNSPVVFSLTKESLALREIHLWLE